jgi:hypothetical protein
VRTLERVSGRRIMPTDREKFDIGEFLTPEWIKELNPAIDRLVATSPNKTAALLGTCLGLLDYCRNNMQDEDWAYVLRELQRATGAGDS